MEHLVHHKGQRFKENLMQHKAPHKLAQGRAASGKNPQEKLRIRNKGEHKGSLALKRPHKAA